MIWMNVGLSTDVTESSTAIDREKTYKEDFMYTHSLVFH